MSATAPDFRLAVEVDIDIIAPLLGYGERHDPALLGDIPPLHQLRAGDARLDEVAARRAAEQGVVVIPTPISLHPMIGRLEARPHPIRVPPARRTPPSPTAHHTILRTPTPMAVRPQPFRLLYGSYGDQPRGSGRISRTRR